MELTALQAAVLGGIALVVGFFVIEVRAWLTNARPVTKRQKGYRTASAAIIVAILAMIFVGDKSLRDSYGLLAAIAYWIFALGLALMLIVMVLADIREIGREFGEERKRMYHDLGKHNGNNAST